jgi:hypothetical protein
MQTMFTQNLQKSLKTYKNPILSNNGTPTCFDKSLNILFGVHFVNDINWFILTIGSAPVWFDTQTDHLNVANGVSVQGVFEVSDHGLLEIKAAMVVHCPRPSLLDWPQDHHGQAVDICGGNRHAKQGLASVKDHMLFPVVIHGHRVKVGVLRDSHYLFSTPYRIFE